MILSFFVKFFLFGKKKKFSHFTNNNPIIMTFFKRLSSFSMVNQALMTLFVIVLIFTNTIFLTNSFTLPSSCTPPDSSTTTARRRRRTIDNTTILSPTHAPTSSPTHSPTHTPTHSPTASPARFVFDPTRSPSHSPTHSPSDSPTKNPTNSPTHSPTKRIVIDPTHSPTSSPTKSPSLSPTHSPTRSPTNAPTPSPTRSISWQEECCNDITQEYSDYTSYDACRYDNNTQGIVMIDLAWCSLTGPIDNNFAYFTSLISLNLSHNKISGSIPNYITNNFENLTTLNLGYNNFSGTIDKDFFMDNVISWIDISSNIDLELLFDTNDITLNDKDLDNFIYTFVNISYIKVIVNNDKLFYRFFHFSNFEELIMKKLILFKFTWSTIKVSEYNYYFCVNRFDISDISDIKSSKFTGDYICNYDTSFTHCNKELLSSYNNGEMSIVNNRINGTKIDCYKSLKLETLNLSQRAGVYEYATECLDDYHLWAKYTDYLGYGGYCDRTHMYENTINCCNTTGDTTIIDKPSTTTGNGNGGNGSGSGTGWFDSNAEWIVPIIVICAIIFLSFVARLFYSRQRKRGQSGLGSLGLGGGNKKGIYKPSRKKTDKTEKDSLLYGDF